MSYGLQVWSDSGATRVFDGSWLFKYHSTHTVTASANSSTTRSISGFDPNTWGVQVVSISTSSSDEFAPLFRVSFSTGSVRVFSSVLSSVTVTFHVFKA